ncbi:MAG: branched-chain amino acid transporter substrate-binding protein [Candidatus Nomurabacteria bacterium]|nr:branched-chain amino acid transporter substrate-binding protein [Candidatus Nomurabacteria bacterium]
MKKIIIVILIISIGILLFATYKQSQKDTIKIGMALGLTGDASAWGEVSLNGAKLAVEEINAKGGIDGKKLELVVEDTKSTSKDSVLAVSKLQDVDKVRGIIITWLDVYHGPESMLKPGVIMISPDAGVEAINGEKKYPGVFSTWYRTEVKSDVAVKHMAESGKKKLYIITQNDSYYITVAKFMEKAAKKYGVEIVGVDFLNPGTDIKSILLKVRAKNPDAVFFAFYDEKLNLEFLKKKPTFLSSSTSGYGDEFVEQSYQNKDLVSLLNGIYFYSPKAPDMSFYNAYMNIYGKPPIFGAGNTYDSVYIISKAWSDNPKDIDGYMRSATFKTATFGDITFDALGGVSTGSNYFVMKQIQKGKAVEVE